MKRLRDECGHASVIPALAMPSPFGSVPLAPHGVRERGTAQRATGRAVVAGASGPVFDRFSQRLLGNQGQALIEYILVLPLVFLLLVNVVNFGGFFYAFVTVANAARAGADYAVLAGASVASPHLLNTPPTASDITTLITSEIASLPNNPSLSVSVCQSGGINPPTGACTSLVDPEAASYVLTSIDVTYTYKPFIPLFSFPNLHINATLPATTIHRRSVMRVMQ
jgi:Flp pilus assembly protein TadG